MERNKKSWRETNGILIHDGDCRFWGLGICTCGLVHHQMPQISYLSGPEKDKHFEDRTRHDECLDILMEQKTACHNKDSA